MNKLVELLNEFEKSERYWYRRYYLKEEHLLYQRDDGNVEDDGRTERELVSKEYGFIKRLVDNNKINIDKYYEFMTNENIDISNACWELDMDKEFYYELLMILAVQENSIEFLISILK